MKAHSDVRVPGRLVLRLASRCFDEPALTTIIEPAVADFQREVLHAGGHALVARVRGSVALAKVLLLALLVPGAGAGAPLAALLLGRGGGSLLLLAPLLFVAVWPVFGGFIAGAMVSGLALAFALRAWNSQHPTAVACTRRISGKDPEINISSVPVGGNIGGFFFVASSALTILLGLPELRWFVVGAAVGGAALAVALAAWHRAHMASPVRRIVVH